MHDGLVANLGTVFGGEEAVLLTDDQCLAHWLGTQGVQAMTFDALAVDRNPAPRRIIAVPLNYGRIPSRDALREMLSASSVLWVPLASFSSDFDTAKYAIEMLAKTDVVRTVATNRRLVTQLLLAQRDVTLSGPDTALKINLPDVLHLSSRTRVELLPDEQSTIGNYFEVALSPTDMAGSKYAALSVSGAFRVDTVLAAMHREITAPMAASFTSAAQLADEIRKACPLQLSIRDSRIVSGLGPWAESIDTLSGREYGGALTEVAFGTASMPVERVDWNLNCPINEGAAGMHVGVGNGLTGIHFDFISTEAWIDGG
jgi:hypothetical protein